MEWSSFLAEKARWRAVSAPFRQGFAGPFAQSGAQPDEAADDWLARDIARVVPVAVGGPDSPVGAVDDQFAAVADSLLAADRNGLGLRGLDNGRALGAGRDNGEAVGTGGDVDGFAHVNCRVLRGLLPLAEGHTEPNNRARSSYLHKKQLLSRTELSIRTVTGVATPLAPEGYSKVRGRNSYLLQLRRRSRPSHSRGGRFFSSRALAHEWGKLIKRNPTRA